MSNHPSTQLLERYCKRLLEGAELLRLDDHLTACADCRETLRRMKPRHDALLTLRANLQATAGTAPAHLPREQLLAYADGQLDEVDRELAESHLEICQQCFSQARDLNDSAPRSVSIADTVSASPDLQSSPPAALRPGLAPAFGLAALWGRLLPSKLGGAIAVLVLLLIVLALWLRTDKPAQEIVDQSTAPSPALTQPSIDPQPEKQPAAAPVLLTLNDGGEQITLDALGNFTGLEALSAADMRRVKAALQTGKVRTPDTIKELRDSSSARMGDSSGKATFKLLVPVGRVVAGDRPTFLWRPLSGAISYRVNITDPALDYKEIANSQAMDDVKWTVDRPLERGRVYAWQVIARTEAGDVKAPEGAEAKFKVLDQSIADDLTRARKVYAGRPLVLGLLYAEAGLLDEAERELIAMAAANPRSPIARSLLRDVQSKRPRF